MKKLILFLLTAIILLPGCSADDPADKPVEYVIYGDGAQAEGNLGSSNTESNVKVQSAHSLDVNHYQSQTIDSSDAPKNKTIAFNGVDNELTLQSVEATGLANCDNVKMQEYGITYVYTCQTDSIHIRAYYRPNGELIYYSDVKNLNPIEGDLTEEHAKEIGLELITSLYGQTVASEYMFDGVSINENGYTYVLYQKIICGYPTLDVIQIKLNGDGTPDCIHAKQRGIFTPLESSITTDKIDAALKALKEQLGVKRDPGEVVLAVGADGKCYVQARYNLESVYYINID